MASELEQKEERTGREGTCFLKEGIAHAHSEGTQPMGSHSATSWLLWLTCPVIAWSSRTGWCRCLDTNKRKLKSEFGPAIRSIVDAETPPTQQ